MFLEVKIIGIIFRGKLIIKDYIYISLKPI